MKTLSASMKHSLRGISYALHTERNLRLHILAFFLVMGLAWAGGATSLEFLFLLVVSGLVMVCELINTAIENVVDLIQDKAFHPLAQVSKDVASGAVLLSALTALLVGLVIGLRILGRWM